MKEWKKEAASGSLPFAEKSARRGRCDALRPAVKCASQVARQAHEAHFSAFSAHSSNSSSFTRIALTNREERFEGV